MTSKMLKVYVCHTDGGHGWLAVKRKELTELGISEVISSFSYSNGGTVYLEEDSDAEKFIVAFFKKHGVKPLMRTSYKNYSHVRNYNRYTKTT